jgi:hypothetical protein
MPISSHTPRAFDLHLEIQWRRPGDITLERGSLRFPDTPPEPGVYRIRCEGADGAKRVYIGETSNLRRRAASYARGTSEARRQLSAQTGKAFPANRQLHDDLVRTLRRGGSAQYQSVKEPVLTIGVRSHQLDMAKTFQRRLIEDAALVYSQIRGRAEIINADRLQKLVD